MHLVGIIYQNTYKILSSILPLRSIPYAEDITGDHQYAIRHNRSTTDHLFRIKQILDKKKWEYNEAMHKLVIDFKKAYDSVTREVLYNILIECGIPMKLVRLTKMCLNETSRVWDGKHLSYMFPIKNSLKQEDALSSLLFSLALEYAIRGIHVNQESLKLKWYTPASSLC